MKVPKVSVIIPTFNRRAFVIEAIESVLKQTYTNYEIIVVDDGSTDKTFQIADIYKGRMTYIWQKNKGVSASRNAGIQFSRGEWLAFLDSDDLWKKYKLENQMNVLRHQKQFKIIYSDEEWFRDGLRSNQGKRHTKYGGRIFKHCLPLCIMSPSSVLIHRSVFGAIGLFNENLPACEDYDMWLRITNQYNVYFYDKPLVTKRGGHSDQLSKKYWGMDRFRVQALQDIIPSLKESHDKLAAQAMLVQKAKVLLKGSVKRNKIDDIERYSKLIETYS